MRRLPMTGQNRTRNVTCRFNESVVTYGLFFARTTYTRAKPVGDQAGDMVGSAIRGSGGAGLCPVDGGLAVDW